MKIFSKHYQLEVVCNFDSSDVNDIWMENTIRDIIANYLNIPINSIDVDWYDSWFILKIDKSEIEWEDLDKLEKLDIIKELKARL